MYKEKRGLFWRTLLCCNSFCFIRLKSPAVVIAHNYKRRLGQRTEKTKHGESEHIHINGSPQLFRLAEDPYEETIYTNAA